MNSDSQWLAHKVNKFNKKYFIDRDFFDHEPFNQFDIKTFACCGFYTKRKFADFHWSKILIYILYSDARFKKNNFLKAFNFFKFRGFLHPFLPVLLVIVSTLQIIQAQTHYQWSFSPSIRRQFYVAPNGNTLGDGSINNPWDLKTALQDRSIVQPGDTILLRGGKYTTPSNDLGFTSSISGTDTDPIVVTSYPGEWAVIDGDLSNSPHYVKNKTILTIFGNYTWFMNFEITNSGTSNRKIDISGSNPPERRGNSLDDYGTGTKIINLIIHDTGQGIGAWSNGRDNQYYGNIVYNNGWDAPDRPHGHGIYTQNEIGSKNFEDNFLFNQFEFNLQTGGSSAASVRNLNLIGNLFFNGGMALRGPNLENLKVYGNYTYNNPFKVGDEINSTYLNADVRENYFMSGVELFEFKNSLIFKNNTVWNNDPNRKNLTLTVNAEPRSKFVIDDNFFYKSFMGFPFWHFAVYYSGNSQVNPLFIGDYAFNKVSGSQQNTYAYTRKSWQDDLEFDKRSTYIDAAPTGIKVFLRKNNYDINRANVIIYNWDRADTVNVDVSQVLNLGDSYELRNVQDYFGDVTRGTFNGGFLQVNMNGRTRAKPVGYEQVSNWYNDPLKSNTFPIFGAFVLVKINTLPVRLLPTRTWRNFKFDIANLE